MQVDFDLFVKNREMGCAMKKGAELVTKGLTKSALEKTQSGNGNKQSFIHEQLKLRW